MSCCTGSTSAPNGCNYSSSQWRLVKQTFTSILIVTLYLDDFLISVNEKDELETMKTELCSHFKMRNFAKSCLVLELESSHNPKIGIVTLWQFQYGQRIMKRFGLSFANWASKSVDCPLTIGQHMFKNIKISTNLFPINKCHFWWTIPSCHQNWDNSPKSLL